MDKDFLKAYENYIKFWGFDSQALMCIEEMSELTKELCKFNRVKNGEDVLKIEKVKENVIEEIADVLNCVEQMQMYFGIDAVNKVRQEKIERTNEYLKKFMDSKN